MLAVSNEFRNKVAQNSKMLFKATLTLADGDVVQLSGDDVMAGSAAFSDAVSGASSFDVGAAIVNKFDVTLKNMSRKFDDYDFTGAVIEPYVGAELPDGTVEWLRKGVYGVEQPRSYGNTIALESLDNMRLLDVPYADVTTSYPATLAQIVEDVCDHCDVVLASSEFANAGYLVQERPSTPSITCRAIVSYAAQASGNWARFDTYGRLVLAWYDTSVPEGEGSLDGGTFDDASPYATGDAADGGAFMTGGASVDGGVLGLNDRAVVSAFASATVVTDDVVVTGLRVTAEDEITSDGTRIAGEEFLFGSRGYVVEVSGNPFVPRGKAEAVARQVGARVVGMRFRPFDLSAIGDPTVEAGDPVTIVDSRNNTYASYVTSCLFKMSGYETMSCNAETPARKSAQSFSAMTKAIVEMRKEITDEENRRSTAIGNLQRQLDGASGLYMTEVAQQDGSVIRYMHDKPTLAQSEVIWKMTANAIGISTDGGDTWPYGLDVNGDAILNRIYAIGLNADYINSGALTVTDLYGNTVFNADVTTGQVSILADRVLIGARKAFADDASEVTIESGRVSFTANTFTVDSDNFKVKPAGEITALAGLIGGFTIAGQSLWNKYLNLDSGTTYKYDNTIIGTVLGTAFTSDNTVRGLTTNITQASSYLVWALKDAQGVNNWKLAYIAKTSSMYSSYNADKLYTTVPLVANQFQIEYQKAVVGTIGRMTVNSGSNMAMYLSAADGYLLAIGRDSGTDHITRMMMFVGNSNVGDYLSGQIYVSSKMNVSNFVLMKYGYGIQFAGKNDSIAASYHSSAHTSDENSYGVGPHINYGTYFYCLCSQDTANGAHITKVLYAAKSFGDYEAGKLYILCPTVFSSGPTIRGDAMNVNTHINVNGGHIYINGQAGNFGRSVYFVDADNNNANIGRIYLTTYSGDASAKGLSIRALSASHFVSLSANPSYDGAVGYFVVLYANKAFGSYTADTLYVCKTTDFGNNDLCNANLKNCYFYNSHGNKVALSSLA